MGPRARFTIASMVSLAVAGLPLVGGCEDGPMHDPAYPIEGGPTRRPTKDAKVTDDVAPPPEPDAESEAGACAPLGTPVEVRNVPEDPNLAPIGGLVADGTYVLTSGLFADATKDGGVAFARAARIAFSGKDVVWQFDTDGAGNPLPTCCAGTWVYQADDAVMVMNLTCNGQPRSFQEVYDYHPTGMPDAGTPDGAEAGAAQLMLHVGALHDVYTRL